MRFIRVCALALVSLATTSCSNTTVRHMAAYDSVLNAQVNMLILPPQVEVNTLDVAGNKERMHDYESHMETVIATELKPLMNDKGFKVKQLHRKEIYDQNLSEVVETVRANYHNIREELYENPVWKEDVASSISKNVGKAAIELGTATQTDLLVLVDYAGVSKTAGSNVLNAAMSMLFNTGGNDAEVIMMILGVIDAKTGNVLWTNSAAIKRSVMGVSLDNMLKNGEADTRNTQQLLTMILKKFREQK